MSIQNRIDAYENMANAALIPWLARTKALRLGSGEEIDHIASGLGAPPELVAKLKAAVSAESTSTQPGLAGSSTAELPSSARHQKRPC